MSVFCCNCGTRRQHQGPFCGQCGERFTAERDESPPPPPPPPPQDDGAEPGHDWSDCYGYNPDPEDATRCIWRPLVLKPVAVRRPGPYDRVVSRSESSPRAPLLTPAPVSAPAPSSQAMSARDVEYFGAALLASDSGGVLQGQEMCQFPWLTVRTCSSSGLPELYCVACHDLSGTWKMAGRQWGNHMDGAIHRRNLWRWMATQE